MEPRFVGRSASFSVEPHWGPRPAVDRFVTVTVLLTCHPLPDRTVGLSIVVRCS